MSVSKTGGRSHRELQRSSNVHVALLPYNHHHQPPIMKFTVAILALAAGVTAMPNLQPRQSPVAITDELAFQLSLPQFTTRRNDRDPPTLDWATDGCTSSPDNPLGFDFVVSTLALCRF